MVRTHSRANRCRPTLEMPAQFHYGRQLAVLLNAARIVAACASARGFETCYRRVPAASKRDAVYPTLKLGGHGRINHGRLFFTDSRSSQTCGGCQLGERTSRGFLPQPVEVHAAGLSSAIVAIALGRTRSGRARIVAWPVGRQSERLRRAVGTGEGREGFS
jgi:hypothetical protein